MGYQWDRDKAAINRRKHGVRFADAVTALADARAITVEDDHPEEERFISIGMDAYGRLLVVIYAYRDEDIRLISARQATIAERRQYEGDL